MVKRDGFFSFNCSWPHKEIILNGFMIVKPDNDTIVIGVVPLDAATDAEYIYYIKN